MREITFTQTTFRGYFPSAWKKERYFSLSMGFEAEVGVLVMPHFTLLLTACIAGYNIFPLLGHGDDLL